MKASLRRLLKAVTGAAVLTLAISGCGSGFSPTATATPTSTPTSTPQSTPVPSPTPPATPTPAATPTAPATPVGSPVVTSTPTPTKTGTVVASPTSSSPTSTSNGLLAAFNAAIIGGDQSTALSYMTTSQAESESGVRTAYGLVGLQSAPSHWAYEIGGESKNSADVVVTYTVAKGKVSVPMTLERIHLVWMIAVIGSTQ